MHFWILNKILQVENFTLYRAIFGTSYAPGDIGWWQKTIPRQILGGYGLIKYHYEWVHICFISDFVLTARPFVEI